MCQIEGYIIHKRHKVDDREFLKNFPPHRLPGLIIHKMYRINDEIEPKLSKDNICIECTFIKDGGLEDVKYAQVLFHAQIVASYLIKIK